MAEATPEATPEYSLANAYGLKTIQKPHNPPPLNYAPAPKPPGNAIAPDGTEKGAQPQSPLLSLPDECLLPVLTHLCMATLLMTAGVSRKLRDLARQDDLWRTFLEKLWAAQPETYRRAYGLRPWLLCEVTVASLDGKGQMGPRCMPWRCAETPQCRIQVEMSYQEVRWESTSGQSPLGRAAHLDFRGGL